MATKTEYKFGSGEVIMFDSDKLPTGYENFLTPLGAALRECEEFCIAPCCGMDAFNLTVEHMQRWANSTSDSEVAEAKHEVEVAIELLKLAPERFHFLYVSYASRLEVIEWYQKISRILSQVRRLA